MFRKMALVFVAATLMTWFTSNSAEAQLYQKFYVMPSFNAGYAPHSSTHLHYVPHGNHIDVIPHTTTHYDRVHGYRSGYGSSYHSNYGHGYGYNHGYGTGYSSRYGANYGNSNFGHQNNHGHQDYWGNGHCRPF